jgi:glycosyltransferase involved in cell wall biosynthesis
MKVILDNIIFSLQKSGGISVVWQQHLKRLISVKEFENRCLEYDNAELNFFRKQLHIDSNLIDLKSSSFLFLKRYLDLNIKDNDKHIFHSSYYRINKDMKAINVTTVHDFTYEHFVKGLPQKVHSWRKNAAILNSKGIICISESTKRDLLHFLPQIDKTKIRVIYNGVDQNFKPLENDFLFAKKHTFEDFSYAIYVGDHRTSYKNFDMAVEACALSKVKLLIIGGGELSDAECHTLKRKLGNENFKSLLNVSAEDLNYYYNKALCLLYPTLYEGFGIPVIEAQQAGCPVIATNSSSIPEVIANPYLAIESPTPRKIANKIDELTTNNLRKETLELGFIKAQNFNWQNTFNQTVEFYKYLYKA